MKKTNMETMAKIWYGYADEGRAKDYVVIGKPAIAEALEDFKGLMFVKCADRPVVAYAAELFGQERGDAPLNPPRASDVRDAWSWRR